jgi:hypothetical protein
MSFDNMDDSVHIINALKDALAVIEAKDEVIEHQRDIINKMLPTDENMKKFRQYLRDETHLPGYVIRDVSILLTKWLRKINGDES